MNNAYDGGFLYGETVQWKQFYQGAKDRYGNTTSGYRTPVDIVRCSVQFSDTMEVKDGTVQRAEVDYVLYVPANLIIDSRDKFIIRGYTCDVVGVAETVQNNFSGRKYRTQVKVKRTDG